MTRTFFALGALSALLAVAAGAFGAHALRARLVPDMQTVFETGARYHMYHALALFVAAGAFTRWPGGPRHRRRLAVRGRNRALLRQPLPARADRPALARRHHAARRPRVHRGLGRARVGRAARVDARSSPE